MIISLWKVDKLINHISLYVFILYIPKVKVVYTAVTWLVFRLKSHAISGTTTRIMGRTQASANAHMPHSPTIKQWQSPHPVIKYNKKLF